MRRREDPCSLLRLSPFFSAVLRDRAGLFCAWALSLSPHINCAGSLWRRIFSSCTCVHMISSTASGSRKKLFEQSHAIHTGAGVHMQHIQTCTFHKPIGQTQGWLPGVRRFLSALALTPGLAASRPPDRPALPPNAGNGTSHFATIPRQRRGRERARQELDRSTTGLHLERRATIVMPKHNRP